MVIIVLSVTESLPEGSAKWVTNNTGNWPQIGYEDIIDYLIKSHSFDSKEMKAFRATYAYNYVQNGWLGDIQSIVENEVHYLKACVSPSQPGASTVPYNAWIAARKDGTVLTACCTCPAGHGRSCSHVAAIMYAVHLAWLHGYAGKSCTDLPCTWGRGTDSNKLLSELKAMNFKHPKRSDDPNQAAETSTSSKSKPYRFKQFVTTEDFTEHVNNSPLCSLWKLKGTLLHKTFSATENVNPICKETSNDESRHGSHDIDYSKTVTKLECSVCQEFYDKYVNLPEYKREELSNLTLNQGASSSPLWKDSRRVRIPASKANSVPKTSRGDPEKFLNNHLYERFKGNDNTAYGVTHEPIARGHIIRIFLGRK
ncbi:uncharacterized protein LOC124258180 [Haliotis rubra]|uniref:uncharacterized protein LOC124258180 n=1 Tax=Haliotis rubra TaxID=36100 RepID=UPI001EE53BD1|nr:uncharacterized protein LOC124258180 [Haliotis rubra]